MSSTVLFSAVDDVAARHPLFVSEVRAFFAQHGLPVGRPEVVAQLADRLHDTAFTEDLVSMLRVVCADEPSISYLELLGLLLAAAGVDPADASLREASEGDARQIFNFLVERRRVMKAELEAVPFAGEEEPVSFASAEPFAPAASASVATPLFESQTPAPRASASAGAGKANAALARALALSADEPSFSQRASAPDPMPEAWEQPDATAQIAPGPAKTAKIAQIAKTAPTADAPEPALFAAHASSPTRATGGRRYGTWLAGLCGLLVGLLLGFFLHRRTDSSPAEPTNIASDRSNAAGPADTASSPVPPAAHPRVSRPAPGSPAPEPHHTFATPGPADPGRPHSRASRTAASPAGSVAGSASGSPVASWASLGNTPAAPLRPGAVHEVRLDAPADLAASQTRGGMRSGRVFVGSAGIMAANLISSPAPGYPAQASAARVQGEVVIEAIVGRDGSVIETRVVSGPPLLRQAALNAVGRWRYRPYEVDGEVAEIATTARLSFQLDGQ